eukprot:CAMPEP_0172927768 /NCGR_PEP_ID=MMETSP1075-20121228/217638_1 /TAXON_ID=2916 /ORGANISM="Ceratium fusus, Strain PA161109" /LENGTH=396 /DNA_ID=CAMNT_0013789043 /DNA_START=209 /DNA_END=1396 /DNA_ORIENTATION=-
MAAATGFVAVATIAALMFAGSLGSSKTYLRHPSAEDLLGLVEYSTAATGCVDDGHNCFHAGCCRTVGHKCFMKDAFEAFCKSSVPAGWLGHELLGHPQPIATTRTTTRATTTIATTTTATQNGRKECTGEHQDPWSTGRHEPCCHGLKQQLGQWDGSGRHHFVCINEVHGGPTCEEQWDNMACVESRGHRECFTCGQRISWVESQGVNKKKAKRRVADEFFGECGACDRISWVESQGVNKKKAKRRVADEFFGECGACDDDRKRLVIETEGYRLVWADEFNSSGSVESGRWKSVHSHGNGFGNHELQFYTDRQTNAWVSDGTLKIRAKREYFGGRKYTSAKLETHDAWRYGKFSVRARLQHGHARGSWPAIWLLPRHWKYGGWPHSGEIDIMEHVG